MATQPPCLAGRRRRRRARGGPATGATRGARCRHRAPTAPHTADTAKCGGRRVGARQLRAAIQRRWRALCVHHMPYEACARIIWQQLQQRKHTGRMPQTSGATNSIATPHAICSVAHLGRRPRNRARGTSADVILQSARMVQASSCVALILVSEIVHLRPRPAAAAVSMTLSETGKRVRYACAICWP